MHKNRLEAFSDGVLAIIITIMVLEMKVPHSADFAALRPSSRSFFELRPELRLHWASTGTITTTCFQAAKHVNGGVLWANLHLLFWLSFFPFVTGWMGENHFTSWPVALYGAILMLAAIAWYILARTLVECHGPESDLAKALGRETKGKISVVLYGAGIGLAFVVPWVSVALYVSVAAMWFLPDRRVERVLLTDSSK